MGILIEKIKEFIFSLVDKQVIDDLCIRTEYNKKVQVRRFPDGNNQDQYSISFFGNVPKRIASLGYFPGPKGGSELIPDFCKEPEFFPHFLRGAIDGDGSVILHNIGAMAGSITVSIVSMGKPFLESILNILRGREFVRGGFVYQTRPNFYTLGFGHYDSVQICNFMYANSTIRLERKYQNYLAGKDYDLKCEIQKRTICNAIHCIDLAVAKGLCKYHYDQAYHAEYYKTHREECIIRAKKWKEENHDEILARRRELYAEDSEYYKAISKKWREENPEKVKEYKQKYNQEHREEINEAKRVYRQENPELHKEMDHRKYEKNKDVIAVRMHDYYEENKDHILEKSAEYRETHKEGNNEYFKKHYQENKERIKKRRMERYWEQKKAKEADKNQEGDIK